MSKLVDKETGEIRTKFTKENPHPSVGLDVSPKIIQNYDFAYDVDTRDLKVVEADKEDREAYIQSFAKETGVYNIMKMYAKTGDLSILNRREGFYGDLSGLPEDELNPEAQKVAAAKAVGDLSRVLGQELTVDDLASMSDEQLMSLISKAVEARTAKAESTDKKDGE